MHFHRGGEEIAARILHARDGGAALALDPPGITVAVADCFADLPPAGDGAPAS